MAQFEFTTENLAKVHEFAVTKQPARVVKQTPAEGTPVLEGMTIEVEVISLSDIPFFVIEPNAPAAVRNVPIADVYAIINNDNSLNEIVKGGTAPDPAAFTQKLNLAFAGRGITTTFGANDAAAIVQSFRRVPALTR